MRNIGPVRAIGRALVIVTTAMVAAVGVFVTSYPRWRRWCLTWGATADEVNRPFPGDELLVEPDLVATRGVSVHAPPESVWPWLAQMGSGRGGLYTYDWIENLLGLHMQSVDVVLPQFQNIQVGDAQTLGKNGPTLRVAICEHDRTLVLRSDDGNWVWAFVLEPGNTEATTRLVSRNRIATPGASAPSRWFYRYVMEPGSLIMERKMLLGIRQRSERLANENAAAGPPGGPTTTRGRAP
jgi:hypothetical protein